MKRLFALIGFTYLIALTAAVYFSHLVTLVLLAVSLVLFIVSIIIKETRTKKSRSYSSVYCVYSFTCIFFIL